MMQERENDDEEYPPVSITSYNIQEEYRRVK